MSDELFWTYFHELYESIPRQGPGLDAFTARALACLPRLRADQRILDIGCGAGVQTLELARRSPATIVATDVHVPFLDILRRRAREEGLADRITIEVADMARLPYADQSFDVLWSEGSSFIVGFAQALVLWRRLLKPGGHLVVSELTWTTSDPPAELREFCVPDPNDDASLAGRRRAIAEAGYALVDEFALPREGWWQTYYVPLLDRLDAFERRHADHPDALVVAERSRHEVDLFLRYGDLYGYTFFVLRR